MATFKQQVEGITSLSIGTTPTNDELSQFLVDGTREVANRIIALKPEEVGKFTLSTNDASDAGIPLTGQIFSVVREHDDVSILRECNPINPGDRYSASDSTSLRYRSKYNPGFYILDGKIHTVPASAGGNNDAIVTQVHYAVNQGHSSSSIDNFPDEYEYLVVLYASIRTLGAVMGDNVIATTAVPPNTLAVPTIDNTAVDNTGVEIGSLGTAPNYDQSATAAVVFRTYFDAQFGDSDPGPFSLNAVAPDSITSALKTVSFATAAPAYTAPVFNPTDIAVTEYDSFTDGITVTAVTTLSLNAVAPDSPTLTAITYSGAGSTLDANAAGFTVATANASSTFATQSFNTFYGASGLSNIGDDDPGPLSINAVAPDAITTAAQSVSFGTDAPEYDAPTYNPTDITITEYDSFTDGLTVTQPTSFSLNAVAPDAVDLIAITYVDPGETDATLVSAVTSTALGGSSTAPAYNNAITQVTEAFADIDAALNAEDIELASGRIQEIQVLMQNELNEFNSLNVAFQAGVQEALAEFQSANQIAIGNAERTGNRELQEAANNMKIKFDTNAQAIQEYQGNLATYQAEVSAEVQEYQQQLAEYQLELGNQIQIWNTRQSFKVQQYQAELGEYNAQLQNSLQEFNEDNALYQAQLQVSVQNVQMQDAQQARLLQKYAADLQTYQAEINAEVQEHTQKHAKYQLEFSTTYTAWVQEYQAAVRESMEELQIANQINIQKAQAEVGDQDRELQRQLQEGINNMQQKMNDNARQISLYQADTQVYQAEVTAELQEFQQKLAEYQLELNTQVQLWRERQGLKVQQYQAELGEYNAQLQNSLQEFNEENALYQAQLQVSIQNAQMEDTNEARQLQLYASDLQSYQAEVAAEIQEYDKKLGRYTQELGVALQAWQNTESNKMQDALNEWNEENATYQANLQKEIQNSQVASAKALRDADLDLQAKIQDYTLELQKYQADLSAYQMEVTAQVQEQSTKMQQYQLLQTQLKAEYDQAFMITAPQQQQEA